MPSYQTSWMYHTRAVRECLPRFGASADLNVQSFVLRVRGRNRYYDLQPQFVFTREGRLQYAPNIPSGLDGVGFIGWLPYFNKRWPTGSDKFAFKELCAGNGLRTPRYALRTSEAGFPFIVKARAGSFATHIRGPFAAGATLSEPLMEGDYCEEFIPGRIAKAWYWDYKLVCLELFSMPTVVGDGSRSFAQLIERAIVPPSSAPPRRHLDSLARYQGFSADDVIPAAKEVLADFRYGSPLYHPWSLDNKNVLAKHATGELGRQFAEAGPLFWRSIPEDLRSSTAYTIDAVVDGSERVWFLEMNCNPTLHPDAYPAIFESLFGAPQEPVREPLPVPASPQTTYLGGALPGGPPPPMPALSLPAIN